MRLIFSRHAAQRMRERAIKKFEVRSALLRPDSSKMAGQKSVVKKIRRNGQLLIIYFMVEEKTARIITVITTSKVHKYLK